MIAPCLAAGILCLPAHLVDRDRVVPIDRKASLVVHEEVARVYSSELPCKAIMFIQSSGGKQGKASIVFL